MRSAADGNHRVPLTRSILWFALVTGLSELLVQATRKLVFHQTLSLSPQIVWLTPVSYLLFLSVTGIGLVVLRPLVPRARQGPLECAVLAFLCGFSFFFQFHPSLHKIAVLLIAIGIAFRVTTWAQANGSAYAGLVSRSTPALLATVVLMGLGLNGYRWVAERRASAAGGQAAPGAPNILLLVLDTVREADLSVYGYSRPTTPVLERLARQGVLFEWAVAPAPWTLPSHASMFTGLNTADLTADWLVPLDRVNPTVAEILRKHGYATAGFVANYFCSYERGLARGFAHYEDYRLNPDELVTASSFGRALAHSPWLRRVIGYYDVLDRKSAPRVNGELLAWTAGVKDRPFFAFVNYFDAHFPYFPPAPFDTLYGPRRPPPHLRYWLNGAGNPNRDGMDPAEAQLERDAYDGAITYLDGQIGKLLEELDRRGTLRNTVVIITSDHGEQFGEHGLYDHGNSLYLPLLHVPLLVSAPGAAPGTVVRSPVNLRDLAATILDLARVPGPELPGRSLVRLWVNPAGADSGAGSEAISSVRPARHSLGTDPAAKGEMYSVIAGRYHYILNGDGREELYDVSADSAELNNLAVTDSGAAMMTRFRASLNVGSSHALR